MCWMGAHLLPNMGKENRLPTTAMAQKIPARASLWTLVCFMVRTPLQSRRETGRTATLSRKNEARGTPPHTEKAVEACWPPLTPEHGFPSLYKPKAQGAPPLPAAVPPAGIFTSFPQKSTKKSGDTPNGASRKKYRFPRLPTAALSASGVRVEGDSFLSACPHKLPRLFCLVLL